MAVIYLLLPLALLVAVCFVALFIWAARDGQFDDTTTPQIRVLFDEESSDARDVASAESRPAAGRRA